MTVRVFFWTLPYQTLVLNTFINCDGNMQKRSGPMTRDALGTPLVNVESVIAEHVNTVVYRVRLFSRIKLSKTFLSSVHNILHGKY